MNDTGKPVDYIDPISEALSKADQEQYRLTQDHEALRQTPEYQSQLRLLRDTINGLISTLRLCKFVGTRWQFFTEHYLLPTLFDEIVEAAITAGLAIENGALNPARRELRYMLEVSVNTAYVDKELSKSEYDKRVDFYRGKKVNKSNVDHIAQLPLHMLGNKCTDFKDATKMAWVKSSNYVHLTKRRLDEKLMLRANGVTLGFESTKMLSEAVREVNDVCSIIVILAFETIGPAFTGDIMINLKHTDEKWPFYANKFIATVDNYFDYKQERQ